MFKGTLFLLTTNKTTKHFSVPLAFPDEGIEKEIKDEATLKEYMLHCFRSYFKVQGSAVWIMLPDDSLRKYMYVKGIVECRTYTQDERYLIYLDDRYASLRSSLKFILKALEAEPVKPK